MQGNVETRVGIFVLFALCVFLYMGFQIGAFRFNKGKYVNYTMYFNDISGLSRKADVKIAGVKVGWVEQITLIAQQITSARVEVMILKDYHLYQNAHGIVRQDGMLGPHFIEVIPGDSLLPVLSAGDTLEKENISTISFDALLHQCKKIASHVEQITDSFKDVVGGIKGKEQLQMFFDNVNTTVEKMASVSAALDRTLACNEATIGDGLNVVQSVVKKIDDGQGLLGKLVNEDDLYQDFKGAVHGFKQYMTHIERLQFVFDTHFESMLRRAENYEYQDSKGYFDIRIHPNDHSFYVIQFAASEKGFAYRKNIERDYINLQGQPVSFKDNHVIPETLSDVSSNDLFIEPQNVLIEREQQFERNTIKLGIQFGKMYKDIAFRLGLFEGTAGLALDIDIPFETDQFRWVSSFEVFDLRGFNRRNDKRPHLKWLNRMFVFDNIYVMFGADDFVSKRNASAFFGAGVRFGDDDVKYIFGGISTVDSIDIQV